MELDDLRPHLHPHLGVEIRERFVEEEHFRLTHNRAPDGDPLPLATGKRLRFSVQQRFDPKNDSPRPITRFLISVLENFRSFRPKARLS